MPMLSVMTHLTLIHTDGLATIVAVLRKHVVETAETVRLALSHNVSLTAQLFIAVKARKMFHVPSSTLSLGTLIGKNYLNDEMGKIC
jgi:hypothetical protein